VFRRGATFVNVDVYPRRDGHVVEGLTVADFQLFEDGKPQHIETLEFIRFEGARPVGARRDPTTKEEGDREAADPRNRVFVIYIDTYHTTREGAREARLPVLDFLQRTIGLRDVFSVLTPDIPPADLVFGRSTATIDSELTEAVNWGLRGTAISSVGRPADEAQLSTCMTASAPSLGDALVVLHREDLFFTGLETLMTRLRAVRDQRKNVLLISEGWVPLPPQDALRELATGAPPMIVVGEDGRLRPGGRAGAVRDPAWCDQQIVRLSSIDFAQRYRDLLTTAARANVSFYPVDVGGLRVNGSSAGRPAQLGTLTPQDRVAARIIANHQRPSTATLRELAENTNGHAVVDANDISRGLRQVASDLSAYYLLGYASSNPAHDGKYRRIEVKTTQPHLSVVARHGYVAPDAATAAAAVSPPGVTPVSAAVSDELARLSRFRPGASLFVYATQSVAAVNVVAEVAPQEFGRGQWSTGGEVRVSITGPGGRTATATGRIEAGSRAALVRVPLTAPETGPWHVAVRAAAQAAALDGDAETAPVSASGGVVGAPICYRGTSVARAPLRPVADFQFRRTERLHVDWPLSDVVEQRSARVLDRRGQPLPLRPMVSDRTDGDGAAAHAVIGVDLPLSALAAGDYLIELSVTRRGETVQRMLAFRIVQP
jgi:VWFA-related protein